MKGVFDSDQFHNRQSVVITEAIATGYVVVFGILTIITHISLLASISFEAYSYLTVCIFVVLLVGLGFKAVKRLEEIRIRDTLPLVVVLLAGGIAGWIVTHFQPIRPFGTLSLDDYYYLANPVYYIRNPGQALSFELHDYYSGQAPFTSASFYTAGAYQYIQAAFAYVLGVNFIQFAYLFVSAISGFMFPISIYLALTKVSRDALGAAIGTAVTLLITMLMGESERSPGSWIFSRVFQGKSIVVSTGIYLIIYFSLEYFKHGKTPAWVSLALTSAALAGMSTTAIMLLPVMAFILFVDYFLIVERAYLRSVGRLFMAGIRYLMSFGYLILFALYIAFVDSTQVAVHANQGYPLTLMGYVRLFFSGRPFPHDIIRTGDFFSDRHSPDTERRSDICNGVGFPSFSDAQPLGLGASHWIFPGGLLPDVLCCSAFSPDRHHSLGIVRPLPKMEAAASHFRMVCRGNIHCVTHCILSHLGGKGPA